MGGDEDAMTVLPVREQRRAPLHLKPLSKDGLDRAKMITSLLVRQVRRL